MTLQTFFPFRKEVFQPGSVTVAEWVNLSKRGGMDRVFRGLVGLLRGISLGQRPREIFCNIQQYIFRMDPQLKKSY